MKPEKGEPCLKCQHWDGRTKEGCRIGRYDSASMVIFGHCGFCEPKRKKEEEA